MPLFQRALAIRERELGPKHPDVARSLHNVADQYSQGAEQFPVIRRALAIREEAFGPDHQDVAQSLKSLAFHHEINGQFDKSEPLRERVLAILQKCLPPEHPIMVGGLFILANFYKRFKKPSKAEPAFRRLLTLLEKFLGPEHSDVAKCFQPLQSWELGNNLIQIARLYREQGKINEAERVFQRAMAQDFQPDMLAALAHLYHADE